MLQVQILVRPPSRLPLIAHSFAVTRLLSKGGLPLHVCCYLFALSFGGGKMKLTCLLDTCPKVNKSVDYRRCVSCGHFQGEAKTAVINCLHPDAKAESTELREARRQAFKQSAVAMSPFLVGPMREA